MTSKNKHMTLQERIEIQECLNKGMSFKAIGKRIGKSATTVSREVKKHLQAHSNSFVKTDEVCPLLIKAPFVCNGREKRSRSNCHYKRQIYIAKKAQADYEALLTESRSGIPLNKESFYEMEKIISSAVKNGQHIYHAIKANDLPVSTATVYRHITKGYYTISSIDLPRAVKFKPRHSKNIEYVPKCVKKGRTYEDYLRQHRTKTALRALPPACLHIFRHFCQKLLEIRQYSCVAFGNLTKNLTAQSSDNLCAVLP